MPRRVADAGGLFDQLLTEGLTSSQLVRDVRVFGLLIGIELDTNRWPAPLASQAGILVLFAQHATP